MEAATVGCSKSILYTYRSTRPASALLGDVEANSGRRLKMARKSAAESQTT